MKCILFSPVTFGLASLALIASSAALVLQSSAQTIGNSPARPPTNSRDFKSGKDAVRVIGASCRAVEMARR